MPIAAKIDARLVPHDQRHNPVNLIAVAVPPVILAPRHLLREPDQVRAGDMVMMPDFSPTHPSKEALGVIPARAVERIGFLVIDPL